MILKFVFLHKNANRDYFLEIMQNLADELDIRHNYIALDNEFLFFANGSEVSLSLFADHIASKMPLSLYFILKSVEVVKDMPREHLPTLGTDSSCFDFDLQELREIKDTGSEHFCDIFDYPKHKISFDIAFDKSPIRTKHELCATMKNVVDRLISKEVVYFQTTKGKVSLCIDNRDFDLVLSNDIATISLYTRASKHEIDALATFEKPMIELHIKDVFIGELGFGRALFILPYDPILSILSSLLINLDVPFLYLKYAEDSDSAGLCYENAYDDRFFEIVLGDNGYFIEKRFLDSKMDLGAFIESSFESPNPMLITYLSTKNPSIFTTKKHANLIQVDFDFNPKNLLDTLSLRPNGGKLLQNYRDIYRDRIDFVYEHFDTKVESTKNILDVLRPISVILGYSKELSLDEIFRYASGSLIDISPRIDFRTNNDDGIIYYDPLSTISSTMSFTLAGVENEMICYGILDSLADFVINIIRDANMNYDIKDVGIIGNLFINKIFFNKITKKFPQDSVLHYPKYLDIK